MPRSPGQTYVEVAVLAITKTGKPMNCREIVDWAEKRGKKRWKSQTPQNSLHAAITRSLKRHDPPLQKVGPGRFELTRK